MFINSVGSPRKGSNLTVTLYHVVGNNQSIEPKNKFLKETNISYENFVISYPCLRHWFGGIVTICASSLGLGAISSLRQRGYTAPKLMMFVMISAGALSGSAFRKYKTGDRRKYFYQPENQF